MSTCSRKVDVLLVAVATGWSFSLIAVGFFALVHASRVPVLASVAASLGWSALAAGNLVFLACVADRAFRQASERLVAWLEILSCVILFSGLGFAFGALLWPVLFS